MAVIRHGLLPFFYGYFGEYPSSVFAQKKEEGEKRPMPLNRLGMLLKKTGYKDVRRGPQRVRGWYVYERSTDEVNANRNKKEDR